MKKSITVYLVILVGVYVIFSVLGSKSEYAVEKSLWAVQKQYQNIAKDPEAVPPKGYDDLIERYQKVIHQYPESDKVKMIHFVIGNIYALKKDYEAARRQYEKIKNLYAQDMESVAQAGVRTARTYEMQDNWPKAHEGYQRIVRDYPLTMTGLGVPIYVAAYYKDQNDYEQTLKAFDEAVQYYRKIAKDEDGKQPSFTAMRYLANCYLEQKRWEEAIETLGETLEKYSLPGFLDMKSADIIIKTINVVSAYQLKNYDKAVGIYQGIIDRKPAHPLVGHLQKMIDAFSQLKEKGVRVEPVKKESGGE